MVAEGREPKTKPCGRTWTELRRRDRGAMGIGHVGLVLGVVALVLGGSGLAIALTHAGPAGATGPAGTPGGTGKNGVNGTNGAPGPGAILNETTELPGTLVNNTTCADEPGADVGFTTVGSGTVMVTAVVTIELSHTMGEIGDVALWVGDCDYREQYAFISPSQPTDVYYVSVSLVQDFAISVAGTYTYYLIGENIGTDLAWFFTTSVVGVYYPS